MYLHQPEFRSGMHKYVAAAHKFHWQPVALLPPYYFQAGAFY